MTGAATECPPGRCAIEVSDGATGAVLEGADWTRLPDSPFRDFVAAICQHVAERTGADAGCGETPPGGPEVRLTFVHRPLIAPLTAVAEPGPAFLGPAFSGAADCRLDTPWLAVRARHTPRLSVQARLVWSERQILLDQALLAGMPPGQEAAPAPLPHDVFSRHVEDYVATVLGSPATQAAQDAVAGRIPPDLLWLFRQSVQSTRAPFSTYAIAALERSMREAAPGYTALVERLLDRCLAPGATGGRYADILSLPPQVGAGQYRLRTRN